MDGRCTFLQQQSLQRRVERVHVVALPIVASATGKHSVGVHIRASFSFYAAQSALLSSTDTSIYHLGVTHSSLVSSTTHIVPRSQELRTCIDPLQNIRLHLLGPIYLSLQYKQLIV